MSTAPVGRDRQALVGIAFMVLAMQVVPLNDAVAKLMTAIIPVLMVVFLRTCMQCLFLALFNLVRLRAPVARAAVFNRHQALRGMLWWLATLCFFVAIKDHSIPAALALFFTGPIFMAVAAPLLLRERFDFRILLAALASFAGVLCILRPDAATWQPGILWSLLAGVCYGLYLMATRHVALQDSKISAGDIAFGAAFWASVFGLPLALYAWDGLPLSTWWMLVVMGLSSAAGHFLIAAACQRTSASNLAPYHYTEMIGALVFSYLLFNSLPTAAVWAGIALIVASSIWVAATRRTEPGGPADAIV